MKTRLLCGLTALLTGLALTNAQAKDPNSMLNDKDENFLKMASQGGMAEVQFGMLGAKKAARDDVKNLANKLVADHTAMNNEVKALAESKKVMLSVVTDPDMTSSMKDLENKETGNGFDEAFLDQLEKDHKKDISEFEDASKNAQDAQVKALAEKALPTLREHLDMIQKLQKQNK